MLDALLSALGVFMLMVGTIGLVINAPQLKRMIAIKNNIKHDGEEEESNPLGHIIEYHASMLAFSIVLLLTGAYLFFIR